MTSSVFSPLDRFVLRVRLQNRAAALHVGIGDIHLAVETARTHQRVIQIFGTIRRGDDHDAFAALETVHGREQAR